MSDKATTTSAAEASIIPVKAARKALDFVADGDVVGLGTGRAASAFIEALGQAVRAGRLRVCGVATSRATAELAAREGIPLAALNDVGSVTVAVDGADAIDTDGGVLKGRGGALLREKIVAAAARRYVLIIGEDKLVARLQGPLPIEVVSFGLRFCCERLATLGLVPNVRCDIGGDFATTDNGNAVIDCGLGDWEASGALEEAVTAIPGVVGTGLFLGFKPLVLVQKRGGQVDELKL